MVALADAKRHLRVTGTDDDALIARLITAATEHLARIGVQTEPEPAPVAEAILVLVGIFHSRSNSNLSLRQYTVEGIGSDAFFSPGLIDEANWQVVRALTDPWRETSL